METNDRVEAKTVEEIAKKIEDCKKTIYPADEDYDRGMKIGFNDGLYKAQRIFEQAITTHEQEAVLMEQKRIKKLLSMREASPRTDFDSDEEYQLHRQKIGAINWYANLIKGQIDLPDLPETTY